MISQGTRELGGDDARNVFTVLLPSLLVTHAEDLDHVVQGSVAQCATNQLRNHSCIGLTHLQLVRHRNHPLSHHCTFLFRSDCSSSTKCLCSQTFHPRSTLLIHSSGFVRCLGCQGLQTLLHVLIGRTKKTINLIGGQICNGVLFHHGCHDVVGQGVHSSTHVGVVTCLTRQGVNQLIHDHVASRLKAFVQRVERGFFLGRN